MQLESDGGPVRLYPYDLAFLCGYRKCKLGGDKQYCAEQYVLFHDYLPFNDETISFGIGKPERVAFFLDDEDFKGLVQRDAYPLDMFYS